MKLSNKTISSLRQSKGFTLIELLIVIAVLGVLATVLLVAINPTEQLARGRDAGRQTDIVQLGRGMSAYYISRQLTAYPAAAVTWQTLLTGSGDLATVVNVTASTLANCTAAEMHTGSNICYKPLTSGGVTNSQFVIWTVLESLQSSVRAGAGTACAAGTSAPVQVYDSSLGKSGMECLVITSGVVADPALGTALN